MIGHDVGSFWPGSILWTPPPGRLRLLSGRVLLSRRVNLLPALVDEMPFRLMKPLIGRWAW
ncbi:hypothetical protein [Tabrizicola sp.]|uniref:hypothetical protein n=1 Tax=Tabrizicola sp. TaxID=2005166 RepID=UPI001A491C17|nr:hypothetical protein [Tabrizicola sp.]MBL9074487.1 hypothetical protein [Tabrizicola sp.]